MDPVLIDADDKHRAPPGRLRSPDFRRMVRLVRPHWRFLIVGLSASVVYGLLHSVGIVGVLPVLKAILADEGFHGWAYRYVAEDRLDVELEIESFEGAARIRVVEVKRKPPAEASPLQPGDRIIAFGEQALDSVGLVEAIARADDMATLTLERPAAPSQPPTNIGPVSVSLAPPSLDAALLRGAAGLVPREAQRSDRVTTLIYVLSCVVAVVVLSNVARFVAQYFTALAVLRAVMDLRRKLYSKVLRLPMDFFSSNTSDIVSRFVQDAQEVQRGLMSLFGKLLREPIKAMFLLIAALWLDARMTVTMLAVAPVAVLIFWAVGRKIRKATQRLLRSYGLMIGALSTTVSAIAVVKASNAEHQERRHLWGIDRRTFRHQLQIAKLEAFLKPLLEVLGILAVAAVTVWLGAQVINRRIELEYFVTLVVALGMLTDPLRKFADVYPRVMRSAAGTRRIFSVLDAPAEAELLEGAVEAAPLSDAIEFRNVTFTYDQAPEPALQDISLTVAKGETVALVGLNGSGKTTLTKLLLRFHDPQEGQVFYDGVDVHRFKLRSLRKQYALVSQDPVVFAMTVAENIAYGHRNADAEAIADAARRAFADEFILEKTAGYDELIGERGSTLSGGQRQRLCIARAILRNAPILIFDEATSQIDAESEHKIQQTLKDFAKGRTTFIVAHRLSTIRFADRIAVMDRGSIIDTGTHDDLLKRCPLYATL
ncbi:MAG: ATP-binding cassette domain-containing protein, partial [bacterium]|nr:ATP-binding cassette domain-containing protein [bacterium]